MISAEMSIPVTLEQVAEAIRQMNALDRQRLLALITGESGLDQKANQEQLGHDYSDYSFSKSREILKVVPGSLSDQIISDREDRL